MSQLFPFALLAAIASSGSALAAEVPGTPDPACRPDFRGTDMLLIGDSISVLPYSADIATAITAGSKDFIVARYAVAGANALHWHKGFTASFYRHKNTVCDSRAGLALLEVPGQGVPDFDQLMAAGKPKALVVALGTNDVNNYCADGSKGAADSWMKGVKALVDSMPAGVPCVWVGPLTYQAGTVAKNCGSEQGVKDAIGVLKTQIGDRCQFVDSSAACPMPLQFDSVGIHPVGQSVHALGNCIGQAVKGLLK